MRGCIGSFWRRWRRGRERIGEGREWTGFGYDLTYPGSESHVMVLNRHTDV